LQSDAFGAIHDSRGQILVVQPRNPTGELAAERRTGRPPIALPRLLGEGRLAQDAHGKTGLSKETAAPKTTATLISALHENLLASEAFRYYQDPNIAIESGSRARQLLEGSVSDVENGSF